MQRLVLAVTLMRFAICFRFIFGFPSHKSSLVEYPALSLVKKFCFPLESLYISQVLSSLREHRGNFTCNFCKIFANSKPRENKTSV